MEQSLDLENAKTHTSHIFNTPLPIIKRSEPDVENPEPDLIIPAESIEGSVTTNEEVKETNAEYALDVDLLWNRNVEDDSTKNAIKKSGADLNKVIANPFLYKLINSKPTTEATIDFGPTYFVIYPMLLENFKVQSYIASDYELKTHLALHSKLASDMYSDLYH